MSQLLLNSNDMSGRVIYNKLIRDLIPHKIEKNGGSYEVRRIDDDAELKEELLRKVKEEAEELSSANTREDFLSEYADLMVVLDTLTKLIEFSEADIKTALTENIEKKGGFNERLFLHWSSDTRN